MEPIIGAVDIGGTKIAVGVVDADGKVLSRMETPTAVDRSYEDDLQLVVSMLRKTFQDAGKKIEGSELAQLARSILLLENSAR